MDETLKQRAAINGLKVLGSSEALPTLVPALGIDQVIVTIADAPQASLRRILSICEGIPVRAQMIPAMYDLLQGRVSITQLREVRVEDLLQSETVSLEDLLARQSQRRSRLAIAGAIVAASLAVAAVTGVLWNRAKAEALRAEAGKLLALARTHLEADPTAALVHARGSLDLGAALAYARGGLDLYDTPEARRFVLEVLWRGPVARILPLDQMVRDFHLPENTSGLYGFALSPDGR